LSASYDPFLYDLTHPGSFRGDVEGYRRFARESGGPVLELGAGTGRITIPIAEDGLAIHALDRDSGMLGVLRHKLAALPSVVSGRVAVIQADMRRFRIDRTFALVIIPFRAFLHNVTSDDQLDCLRCAHSHLRAGGRLAFNVFHPSLEYMSRQIGALEGAWRLAATHPTPDGGMVVRSETTRYDTPHQRLRSLHRYEQFDDSGVLTRTTLRELELAYLYPPDILHLLERAGFSSIRISSDFDGHPFDRDTDELIVDAVRA